MRTSAGICSMGNFAILLALAFSYTSIFKEPPRRLYPQVRKPRVQWYLAQDGRAYQCSGRPHKILTQDGIKIAVEGCGAVLQIILKD